MRSPRVNGYEEFEQTHGTWPRCGYDHKYTKLAVRRVIQPGQNEAQIEVLISEVKGDRVYDKSASVKLTPDEIKRFIAALQGEEPIR